MLTRTAQRLTGPGIYIYIRKLFDSGNLHPTVIIIVIYMASCRLNIQLSRLYNNCHENLSTSHIIFHNCIVAVFTVYSGNVQTLCIILPKMAVIYTHANKLLL